MDIHFSKLFHDVVKPGSVLYDKYLRMLDQLKFIQVKFLENWSYNVDHEKNVLHVPGNTLHIHTYKYGTFSEK
jgi:hypothetical protein